MDERSIKLLAKVYETILAWEISPQCEESDPIDKEDPLDQHNYKEEDTSSSFAPSSQPTQKAKPIEVCGQSE